MQERNRPSQVVRFRCDHAMQHFRTSRVGILLTFARNHCLRDCERRLFNKYCEMDCQIQFANSRFAALNFSVRKRNYVIHLIATEQK